MILYPIESLLEQKGGWIFVFCGCMFSGKTTRLIHVAEIAERLNIAKLVFKPEIENRFGEAFIGTHDGKKYPATPGNHISEMNALVEACNPQLILIDEVQFFDASIVEQLNEWANQGRKIMVAGLDLNHQQEPFGHMPLLLAKAEYVQKVQSICAKSGEVASFTLKKSDSKSEVEIGGAELYEARNRNYIK